MSAWLVVALVASLLPVVAGPQAGALAAPAGADAARTAAAQAAAGSGQAVEVESLRTETEQVFANPDGTFTLSQSVLPVRVRRGAGWVPVDTTLHRRADGSIAPAAAAVDLTLSGGGAAALVRVSKDGHEFGLGWPGALPAPVLDGSVATYPEVLPGVDLAVTVSVLGFSEVLVVKSAEAAKQPALQTIRLTTSSNGLRTQVDDAGNTAAVDDAGRPVFQAGTPLLWDSAGTPVAARDRLTGPAAGAAQRAMTTTAEPGALVLSPGLSQTALTYPVYVDPNVNYAGGRLAWTSVWKAHPTSTYYNSSDVARVGHEDDTGMTNRSFFRMNTAGVKGKHIISATFRTYLAYSWSCSARNVEVWRTGIINSATNWNNQPGWADKLATVNVAKGYSSSCNPGGVDFNVTAGAVTSAAANAADLTLGLRATSETDTYAWKKFRNNPTLEIVYNTIPAVPTALSTDPGLPCITGASRPVIGTATPTLRAKITDVDAGQTVGARFDWHETGLASNGQATTTKVASGAVHSVTVPSGSFLAGHTYSWRVRAEDGTDVSDYSAWCELTIDATPPGKAPNISSAVYPQTPPGAEPIYKGAVGLPGSFVLSPGTGDTDVQAYVYGLNVFPPSTTIAATGSPATATVTLTPTIDLLNTLYVRSKDAAGNLGPIYGYQFYVRPVTFPVGDWPLDDAAGTLAADVSGDNHPATATGGTGWTAGRVGGAATLNGTTGSLGTAVPVLRTDLSFTVAAWVRLSGSSAGNYTAVSQDGTRNSGFMLRYDAAVARWAFEMYTTDTDTEVLHRAASTAPPRYNVWTHLVGVYDKTAGQLSLYVDGVLQTSAAHTGAWNATGGVQLGRGKWHGLLADRWPGDLDDVRLFQGVLPAETIADLANPPATLVGHWKLDETSGTVAADASGGNRPATLSGGTTWEPGWDDGALTVNGTTGSAGTAAPVLRTDQSFTVSAWVRFTGATEWRNYTAVAQDGARNSGFLLQYATGSDRWCFAMPVADDGSGDGYVTAMSTVAPAPDTWTHLAGVYDASAGQLRLYVDGVLVALTAKPASWHAAGGLQIGRAKWAGYIGDWWAGGVDDVRAYQGALGDEQIQQLALA